MGTASILGKYIALQFKEMLLLYNIFTQKNTNSFIDALECKNSKKNLPDAWRFCHFRQATNGDNLNT